MKGPNFFIIGAPKCGTTSLDKWLRPHPNIYIPPKELNFFDSDHNHPGRCNRRGYERWFAAASPAHTSIGEDSPWYLYSKVAVPQILETFPEAKFIVCLRNPVEMAPSLHDQLCVSDVQHIADFETAWRKSLGSDWRPRHYCVEPAFLDYCRVCRLGAQLSRLFNQVAPSRVLTVVLDDVRLNARAEYLRVLNFLGVPDDGRTQFPVENRAREISSLRLRRLVRVFGAAKRSLRIPCGLGLLEFMNGRNLQPRKRPPMPPRLRTELCAYFSDDVRDLSSLLGRDLTGWTAFNET